ncbi:uncharacterized protein IL334_006482 [Kwoniella shivajii]|uniref:Alginate lyase domain-containing protein n=1 Tax=Kwoniella shivajii TaxID=564305 RepID=A0ABZ1D6N5_9TREE|nr:hypothetical protein IL334_006482 [Kwoniella shivajii]
MSESLPIPHHPLDILLPPPNTSPTPHALHMLEKLCDNLCSENEIFSITFSPVLCPVPVKGGGGKNQLFTIKPHWWQNKDGKWEWRDGQRNPECARPQGQVQLEKFSKTIQLLSLGAAHFSDNELKTTCVKKIENLLNVFFLDPETRMEPQVRFSQCHPGEEPVKGNDQFVIAIRSIILTDQSLNLIRDDINVDILKDVENWIKEQLDWVRSSEQGMKAKNSPKPLWYNVILSSHLHFIQDSNRLTCAGTALQGWIDTHPLPEDSFMLELIHDNRRHRCLFTLEPLFILASLASDDTKPQSDILEYLKGCVGFVKTVVKGPIESPKEDDVRYLAKIAWLERLIDSWENEDNGSNDSSEPEGRGWEGDWDDRMKMLWGFI